MGKRLSRIVFLVLAASFLALSSGCMRDPAAKKQKFLELGNRAFAQGKFADATIQYGRALQIDPRFEPAHYGLARCYLKQGVWAAAYQELGRTIEIAPENWPAQLDLGKLLLSAGKGQEAKDQAMLILHSDPGNSGARVLLSGAEVLLGNRKEALDGAETAVRLAPDGSDMYLNLGLVQARYGMFAESEKSLRQAQALDPRSVGPRMTLGSLYQQHQRWSEAEKEFQAAIQIAPTDPLPRATLAGLYRSQGQDQQVEKVLTEAKQQLNSDPNAYRMLADYFVSRGDTGRALVEYESLSKEHPEDTNVRKARVQLLILAGRIEEASRIAGEMAAKSPRDPETMILQGQLLLKQKKTNEALLLLQQAVKAAPDNPSGHLQLGLALKASGSSNQAQAAWREAIRLRPNLAEAWNALGADATERADWRELRADGEELQKIAPRAPEGYLFSATARFNLQDAAGAEAQLNHLLLLAPGSALAYTKLGQLRTAQGRWKDAENYYREALGRAPDSIDAIEGQVDLDLRRGRQPEALQFIAAQINRRPSDAGLYLIQGSALLRAKQLDEAEKALSRARDLDPQNLPALVLLGQVQSALGRPRDAISSFEQAVRIAPNTAGLYTALGAALESQGSWHEAQTAYQKGLAAHPDDAVAANNLAYLLLERGGDVNVALTLAQTARRGMPNLANSADTLGWAYFQNGAYALAASLLDQAVKQAPKNATYHYHLGMAYQKLNNQKKAREELQKSIELDPQANQKATVALGELPGS